jgi:hypothetical protein
MIISCRRRGHRFSRARRRHGRLEIPSHREPTGGRDSKVLADLPREPEVDLPMARNSRRALAVETPEAVVAALAQQARAVGA